MKTHRVILTKSADKDFDKVPKPIQDKLLEWMELVRRHGIDSVRMIPSFRDKALKGKRASQRSIRLNRAYRAFYKENHSEIVIELIVLEVNKHEY